MAAVPAHSPPSLRSLSSLSFPVYHSLPFAVALPPLLPLALSSYSAIVPGRSRAASAAPAGTTLVSPKNNVYTVGDFMTTKENLHIVKPYTTVNEALEILVENRITGFPVVDDDWKLVFHPVILLLFVIYIDFIYNGENAHVGIAPPGGGRTENNMFPEVDSTWKTFNAVQKLLSKTNGRVVGDVMTPAPVVVRESSNLEDAAGILLQTKYRRLPVVDAKGRLVGILTRGNVVRAALHIKRESGSDA